MVAGEWADDHAAFQHKAVHRCAIADMEGDKVAVAGNKRDAEFDQGGKETRQEKRELFDRWLIWTIRDLANEGLVKA